MGYKLRRIIIATGMLVVLIICIFATFKNSSLISFYRDTADTIFETNFALFCNGLNNNVLCKNDVGAETKHIYLCTSIYPLTSYSENQDLNRIVRKLCEMSERGVLWDMIDEQLTEGLNRLSSNLDDNDMTAKVYTALFALDFADMSGETICID